MKTVIGSVVAAAVASACCLGPVLLSLIGAGAFGAAASSLEPYRPYFIGVTVVLLGGAFYATYRPAREEACGSGGACTPSSRRAARIALWLATVVVVLLLTFPYYIGWLV